MLKDRDIDILFHVRYNQDNGIKLNYKAESK